MNITQYIDDLYRSRTESNLSSQLLILNSVASYKRGDFFKDSELPIFEKLVEDIIAGKVTIHEFNEANVGQIFQINDFEKQRQILELAFYEAGDRLSASSDTTSLEQLGEWMDACMGVGFFLSYSMSEKKLTELVESLRGHHEQILEGCYVHSEDKENWIRRCKDYSPKNKKTEEIIDELKNSYNDFIELPLGISALAFFICRDCHWDLFLDLMNSLVYPELQKALISEIITVEQCLDIQDLILNKDGEKEIIMSLFREKTFQLLFQQQDYLERNANNEYLKDKQDRQHGIDLLSSWQKNRTTYIDRAVCAWENVFNHDELTDWIAENKLWLNLRNLKSQVEYIVKALSDRIYSNVIFSSLKYEKKKLETLFDYAKTAAGEVAMNEKNYVELITQICKSLYKERFVKLPTLKDLELLRALYICLEKSNLDGYQLMEDNRTRDEGFAYDSKKAIQSYNSDTFWLSVLVLQLESIEDEAIVHQRLNALFAFLPVALRGYNDAYLNPFMIAELVVAQIHQANKDWYEHHLISSSNNLMFVLRVLSSSESSLSESNKKLLKNRIEKEWSYEKEVAVGYNKNFVSFIDSYAHNL